MDRQGSTRFSLFTPVFVVLTLLFSGLAGLAFPPQPDSEVLESEGINWVESRLSSGDVDVPSLRVGDSWIYDGLFDVAALVAGSGQVSNIQSLSGDLDMWIDDIVTVSAENQSTLAYKVRSSGVFRANSVTLQGFTGDLVVDYDGTDYIRVSDLATVSMQMNLDVVFDHWLTDIDIANLQVVNSYSPPREDYDFPLRVGEGWSNNYTQSTTWSGSSDYFTIPSDSEQQSSSGHAVVSQGNPNVPYSGCNNAYNVTSYDSNGTVASYRWWCPGAKNDAWRHFQDDLGLIIDFKMKSFSPQSRSTNLDVELEYPTWLLNGSLGGWVNVTDSSGSPLSGQTVEWRLEANGQSNSLTTASNGSAYINFNSGTATDPSPTSYDYASHGIIAWMAGGKKVGVDTLTLDDNLVSIDYRPRSEGVSVERTRDGVAVTLDPAIGYNAVPGDTLQFTVPVENRGILPGPSTQLEIIAPDGTTSRVPVPALSPSSSVAVVVTWNVPPTQPVGDVAIQFEVDPDGVMTEDANQSNDIGEFGLFIGRLPEANLIQPPATRTLTMIPFDGRNSVDPDGGSPHCTFVVEVDVATNETFEESDCLLENSWDDDGEYKVWLTVTDDENDQDSLEISVTIVNRAPWVNISSPLPAIPVETTITFDAYDSGDLDTRNTDAPVDLLWQPPTQSDGTPYDCEQGLVGMECTITPLEEGMFRIQATVEDDDFAATNNWFDLLVTNIAPSDAVITMWRGDEQVFDASDRTPPIWEVFEDEPIILRGDAHDSLNDMDSLTWGWQPDLDIDRNWYLETVGSNSEIQVSWEQSGGHIMAMEVIDNDGQSSGIVNGWVEVKNVPPTVESFSTLLPVGEDRVLELTGEFSDTSSDLDSLQVCWDVDFMLDVDENGDTQDDCDYVGANLAHSWSVNGEHMIRFHVTDDDGESADAFVNVSVVNLRPKAAAEAESLSIQVGEELVIWTNGTTDSASDMAKLRFEWDLDTSTDWDDDGDPANDIELVTELNQPLRHIFLSEGTKNIRLRVSDESATSTVDFVVTVEPDDKKLFGWIDKNTAGVSNYVVILGLVLALLLGVLAFTTMRRTDRPRGDDWFAGGGLLSESLPTSAPPTYAFDGSPPTADGSPPLLLPDSQPVASTEPAAADVSGEVGAQPFSGAEPVDAPTGPPPPIPTEGLPPGWTQEQWEWYGHEWLEEQSQTPPGLADGLDLDL